MLFTSEMSSHNDRSARSQTEGLSELVVTLAIIKSEKLPGEAPIGCCRHPFESDFQVSKCPLVLMLHAWQAHVLVVRHGWQ
jgi:hypothetical protein